MAVGQTIVLASVADERYAWPATLALLSAAAHSGAARCLLVGDRLAPDTSQAISDTFSRAGVAAEIVESDLKSFESLPAGFHFSRATYGRLLVPELAARLAERTLYLDADTLTVGDLAAAAQLPLGDHIAAAVPSGTVSAPGAVADWRELGLSQDAPFFNSGVMLIDNGRWLAAGVAAGVSEKLKHHPGTSTFADQGTLNSVLAGQWAPLDHSWNRTVRRGPSIRLGPLLIASRSLVWLRRVRVLHYFQSVKPWQRAYPPGALRDLYADAWSRSLPTPLPTGLSVREWLKSRR
jgi:lipopolysaccharide biosynthesis glycosyltransferase